MKTNKQGKKESMKTTPKTQARRISKADLEQIRSRLFKNYGGGPNIYSDWAVEAGSSELKSAALSSNLAPRGSTQTPKSAQSFFDRIRPAVFRPALRAFVRALPGQRRGQSSNCGHGVAAPQEMSDRTPQKSGSKHRTLNQFPAAAGVLALAELPPHRPTNNG